MNKELKPSQLARALGVSQASIAMAVKNKKLIESEMNGKKVIDISNQYNKLWIDTQIEKGKTFDLNNLYNKKATVKKQDIQKPKKQKQATPENNVIDPVVDEEKTSLSIRRAKADTEKAESDARLKTLQADKMQGLLVPTEAVKSVFIYSVETVRTTFLQELNSITNVYIQKFGGSDKDYVEIRKDLSEVVQGIAEQYKENLMNGIEGVVADYMEVRARGERR